MQRWGFSVFALCLAGTAMAEQPFKAAEMTGTRAVTFHFREPMQTLASQEVTPPAHFVPALPVTDCHWTNDTALTCAFVKDAPRATKFTATLPPNLRTVSGKSVPIAPITFETERPKLWVSTDWKSGRPVFVVNAWKSSPEASVTAALRMSVDGKSMPVKLRKGKARYAATYYVDAPKVSAESTLVLSIVPGLVSSEGPLRGTQKQTAARAIVGEPFQVRGAVCAGAEAPVIAPVKDGRIDLSGCIPTEQVRVLFSGPIDKTALEVWRETWPANLRKLPDSTESAYRPQQGDKEPPARAPTASISFAIDAMHADQAFAIPALPAEDDGPRLAPVELHVRTTAPRPSFFAPFTRALLERGADPKLQSINAPPIDVETFALSGEATRASAKTPQSPDTGTRLQFDNVRRALEDGGYAAVRTDHEGREIARLGQMEVAAPDFDVHASVGLRTVLAWVNAWEGDAPIADAQATLLLDEGKPEGPRVIATGTTDAQGVVLLRLPQALRLPPDDAAAKAFEFFLRVERGRGRHVQRAVLPVQAGRWDGSLGTPPDVDAWGVTDRPLYRAGDIVRWTVWTREDDGRRYVAPGTAQAQTLRLSPEHQLNALVTWEATFDEHGRATGETRIPIHTRDGEYCVGTKDDAAVCFHVGTFRPQDLWARASTKQTLLRTGDTFAFDVASGFYSGGSGAGIAIENIEAALTASSPAQAWPQWREYIFAKGEDDDALIEGLDAIKTRTDSKGHATLTLPVDARFKEFDIPFALLSVSVEARPADREATTTNSVQAHFAAHARYVGIKVEMDDPNGSKGPVRMTGVVIDAAGKEIAAQRIDVDVTFTDDDDETATSIHTCTLISGVATDCTFPRRRSGVYAVHASSSGAAPAMYERVMWVAGAFGDNRRPAQLEVNPLGEEKTTAGEPIRFEIRAPHVPARALVTVSRGADVFDQRVVTLLSPSQIIEIPTAADWPLDPEVSVFVRRTDAPPPDVALPVGFRRPIPVETESLDVQLQRPVVPSPVSVAFESMQAAPAQTVRLVVRNDSDKARGVTLAVTDDALRALGAEWLKQMDPAQAGFRVGSPYGYAVDVGFEDWNKLPLRWVLARNAKNPDCVGRALDDCIITIVGAGAINPIDVDSVESATVLTAGQVQQIPVARDTTSVALLAPGTVRNRGEGTELSSVTLEGNALNRAAPAPPSPDEPPVVFDAPSPVDVQARAPASGTRSGPPRPDRTPQADYGASLARIRTQFADTALWRSDIVLAPGESKTVELVVPDNLTRWRAVAWSYDDADDFAMAEATLEAGLPVEARLQTPVRIYPGDKTRLALNVRQAADHATQAEARISLVQGPSSSQQATTLSLPANGQASFALSLAPEIPGTVLVTGAAATPDGRDAVAAPIEVASTSILATRTQAGWVGASPLSLELPTLPNGTHDAHLDLSVWRGASALVDGWTEDMRVYPHRCWEQILSRAVAAALAIERKDPSWPDAKAVVQEALDNAGAFQTGVGSLRYFNGTPDYAGPSGTALVPLTAYTLDAFALLRSLGYPVDAGVEARARAFLSDANWNNNGDDARHARAVAAALVDLKPEAMHKVVSDFESLALPGKVAAARALARTDAPEAAHAFTELLALAPQRGEARSLQRGARFDRWMSSPMREQCELIRLLEDYPRFAPEGARRSLIAGLTDLYAGGVADIDTQSASSCLHALRAEGKSGTAERIVVDAKLGAQSNRLTVAPGEKRAAQRFGMGDGRAVTIAPVERPDAPVAYLTRIEYQEDARHAHASAMGFAISRRYEVKRGTTWTPLGQGTLRDDDWVRITLAIDSADARYFVAVTDDLPGGLRPVDMDLTGVSGAAGARDVKGSGAFDERKLDPRKPKFYAQRLPAGHHEIQYYARVGNTGDYLAAPAVVELMYGEASRARTAADRIRIADPRTPPTP